MITSSMASFQKWIGSLDSQIWKQKFSLISQSIVNITAKWTKHFQTSISLWVQFILLKTQSQYNNAIPLIKGTSLQSEAVEISNKITNFLTETEQCVVRGLINIQKLYMIPLARQKKLISQKQKNPLGVEMRQKVLSKTRSSSLTNSRKSSLFYTGIKPNKNISNVKNLLTSKTQSFDKYAGICSNITKNLKGKPRQDKNCKKDEISNKQDLLVQSSSNWNSNNVQSSMHYSMVEHFQQKQKIGSKSLSQVEQKIKNIQQNINQKLNIIMESLIKYQESAKDDKKQQQIIEETQTNQKQIKDGVTQKEDCHKDKEIVDILKQNHKQIKRRSTLLKKSTINSIAAEPTEIEEVILTQNTKNSILLEKAEKNLQDFIGQTKKVKLPISQQFTNIFLACYKNLCKKYGKKENTQKLGLMNEKKIIQMDDNGYRKLFKESLMKLKKLLSMDTIKKDLAEKIRVYTNQTIKCGYILLLFQEQNEVKESTEIQIDRIAEKL